MPTPIDPLTQPEPHAPPPTGGGATRRRTVATQTQASNISIDVELVEDETLVYIKDTEEGDYILLLEDDLDWLITNLVRVRGRFFR